MDLRQYIESGILESYLLGELSDQERQEVECLAQIYPEIRSELRLQEEQLESLATSLAKPAPPELKAKVMSAIAQQPQETGAANEPKVNRNFWPWLAAASIVIAMLATGYFFKQRSDSQRQNDLLQEQEYRLSEISRKNTQDSLLINHLTDPNTRRIRMEGQGDYSNEEALVYWNSQTRETFVVLQDLTPAPKGLSYQLWAIVNGKPLDLGVYENENTMIAGRAIDEAEAFAITLEKKGGSPEPNLERLVVIGKIKS